MSGFWIAVILLSAVAVVAAVVLAAFSSRRRFDEPPKRGRPGDDSYPTGARPAGPGAEGMRVEEPGEITPGPADGPDEGNRTG